MPPRPESLGGFALRTFLWLPACFAAWYALSGHHASLVGSLARAVANAVRPGLVTAVEPQAAQLAFVTGVVVPHAAGEKALLVPEVDALLYTFGLAFFAALMLGSRARWWALAAGAVALLPFQAWGVAFDLLVQLAVRLGPEISAQAGLHGHREAIVLGYQAGALIFPTLMPVVLWAAFNRAFIERVLRARLPGAAH